MCDSSLSPYGTDADYDAADTMPNLRRYIQEDQARVLQIWEDASQVGHAFLSAEFLRDEWARVRDVYLPHAETLVAEEEGDIVGFLALVGDEVGGLFVDPKRHGHGVGRALIQWAFALRGRLRVEVFSRNKAARAFYTRCGFRELSEHRHHETGQRAICMERMS